MTLRPSLALLLLPALLGACSSVDASAVTTGACSRFDDPRTPELDFRSVSRVVELRCGSLDCHGSIARPMRIYGQYGLRRADPLSPPPVSDAGPFYPGIAAPATSEPELEDNYTSMCALEPEIMARVVTHAAAPDALTLVRKPRLTEKHKGGQVWNVGDSGDACLTSWLTGAVDASGAPDTSACAREITHP